MNSQTTQNDFKQTNFDYVKEEDSNDDIFSQNNQNMKPSHENRFSERQQLHRVKITDKPIPLDHVIAGPSVKIVEIDNQLRYQKLKEARDRLLNQKHNLKPTPIIVSPVKKAKAKESDGNDTSDTLFQPASTKIFPSSKQREDRIRLLKKMIYKSEIKPEQNQPDMKQEEEEVPNIEEAIPIKIEPLKEISLSPPKLPESPVTKNRRLSSGTEHTPKVPSKLQNMITEEDLSSTESGSSSDIDFNLDSAIKNFQNLQLSQLENEIAKEEEKDQDLFQFKNCDLLFEDVEKRLAILEFKIDKISNELALFPKTSQTRINFPSSKKAYFILLCLVLFFISSCVLAD